MTQCQYKHDSDLLVYSLLFQRPWCFFFGNMHSLFHTVSLVTIGATGLLFPEIIKGKFKHYLFILKWYEYFWHNLTSCVLRQERDVYNRKVDKSMPDVFRPLLRSLQGLNHTQSVNILYRFTKMSEKQLLNSQKYGYPWGEVLKKNRDYINFLNNFQHNMCHYIYFQFQDEYNMVMWLRSFVYPR